jgi:soluble P-type ATPase
MMKPGVLIETPGFRTREINTAVSDYTGTLSFGGRLTPGIREKLVALLDFVDIRIVSSDSFGTATEELRGIVKPHILNVPPKVEPAEHEPIEEQARGRNRTQVPQEIPVLNARK